MSISSCWPNSLMWSTQCWASPTNFTATKILSVFLLYLVSFVMFIEFPGVQMPILDYDEFPLICINRSTSKDEVFY